MAKRKTTLEKFQAAKRDYESEVFKTVEEAAKAHNICPATYYNYSKKIPEPPKVSITEVQVPDQGLPLNLPNLDGLSDRIVNKVVDKIIEKLFARS